MECILKLIKIYIFSKASKRVLEHELSKFLLIKYFSFKKMHFQILLTLFGIPSSALITFEGYSYLVKQAKFINFWFTYTKKDIAKLCSLTI